MIYRYDQSKEEILAKILVLFNKKVKLFGTDDTEGYFRSDGKFVLEIRSPWIRKDMRNGNFNPYLVAEVCDLGDKESIIRVKAKPRAGWYIFFVMLNAVGIYYTYLAIQTAPWNPFFGAIGGILGGSFLSIGLTNVANGAIIERHEMYIHNELKKWDISKSASLNES